MHKIHESQKKFEEATLTIANQSSLIDDLNGQLEKLKDVNSQLDYTWGEKYNALEQVKDAEYDKTKRSLQT